MTNNISRRSMLASGVGASAVIGLGIVPSFAAKPAMDSVASTASVVTNCAGDHKKWGYRLGALMVDPTLEQAEKDILLATAVCPHCHTKIEPQGLSYSEHMPA